MIWVGKNKMQLPMSKSSIPYYSRIRYIRRAQKVPVSVAHLNTSTGSRSTAAGTATPVSAAFAKHLRDGLLNATWGAEPDVPLKKILFWNKVSRALW